MKKLLVFALAAVSMVACMKEETTLLPQGDAISFDSAFIDNATRAAVDPSTTTASLDGFKVWGFVNEYDGTIFDGTEVKKVGGAWSYQGTQYWVPGQSFYFAALAPMSSANWRVTKATGDDAKLGLGTVSFENVNGTEDLLYAKEMKVANSDLNVDNGPVKFQFQHLLSKVKFTFTNGFPTETASIKVTDVKMVVPHEATIDLAQADYAKAWTLGAGTTTLAFGDVEKLACNQRAEVAHERLTIPAADTQEYDITFTVELFMGAQSVYTKDMSSKVSGYELAMGNAYNFTAVINAESLQLENIVFEVEVVKDWVSAGEQDVYVGETAAVADANELMAAIADPAVTAVVLTEDIDLGSTTITRAEDEAVEVKKQYFTIDGNGKTLTYNGSGRVIDFVKGDVVKNATIKNLTINIASSYCERGINFNNANGTLVVENVTFAGTAPTYAINFPSSANGADVTIKNSYLRGNIALNVWGKDMTINAYNTEFVSVDNTEVEGYSAVKLNNNGSTSAEGTIINIEGGKIIARDENDEPSTATYNATVTGVINVSETTEVVGTLALEQVAIVDYGTNQFYGMSSLQAAIDKVVEGKSGRVVLTKNIELTEGVNVPKGATVEIDLNGKTITGYDASDKSYGLITNYGNLTVKNGTLTLKAEKNREWNAYSSVISNNPGGNLVVENVTIEHLGGTDMAYGIDNLTNGKGTSAIVTVNEGAVVKSTYRAIRQFLNGIEATNELTVNAGAVIEGRNKSIWMQDPSKNANTGKLVVNEGATLKGDVYLFVTAGSTEWPVEVSIAESALAGESEVLTGNVPAGYIVIKENGAYVVAEVTVANDQASLNAAIQNGEETVIVAAGEYTFPASSVQAGQTIICEEGAVFTGKSSLNINGATVVGANFKNEGGEAVSGTIYGNFKDCTFEGAETLRWCYTTAGQTTVFENCVVKTTLRGVHFDGMDGDVIFRNCEINGFNAYSGAGNITFEGCTFGNDASKYNGLNIYSNTHLVNCTFNFKSGKTNFIDMEGTGKTLTITNCTATLDGAAANVADFIGGSKLAENTVVFE